MSSSIDILDALINIFSSSITQIKYNSQQNLNCQQHFEYINKYDVEYWYKLISHLTFKTKFIPITTDEAKQLISIYEQRLQLQDTIKTDNGEIITTWLTDQINQYLFTLKDSIQQTLNHWNDENDNKTNQNNQCFFCKFSSRSPKDAIINEYYYTKTKKLYLKFLQKDSQKIEYSLNDKKIALNHTMINLLKCNTSNDMLLLCLYSERVYKDLKLAFDSKIWKQNIIIREWYENINVMYEFRGFVYNNKLNAISQYQKSEKCQFLIENKNKIQMLIINFWETECKDLLCNIYDDYIIDFLLIKSISNDISNWNVKVIELNPYSDDTGALLFSWQFDRYVLQKGPFEMRLQKLSFGEGDIRKLYPIHRKLLLNSP
eukprot:298109_1